MDTTTPLLAWVDLETVGLDAHHDPILEVGVIVTAGHTPFTELAEAEFVIRPEGNDWTHRMNPKVLEMHTGNGLLANVFASGVPITEVEQALIGMLDTVGSKHDFVLAGSGVAHFDRRFIDAQMPALSKWLRYYTVDVGVLRRSLAAIGLGAVVDEAAEVGKLGGRKEHRAFGDIESHLAEMRFYADRLASVAVPSLSFQG